MSKPNRKLRVGVTIHIRDGQQSIWENGIFQNCVFLVQLFNLSTEVDKAVLVNGSGAKEVHSSMMFKQVGVEMIDLSTALETLDVVIEMSSQVPEDWLERPILWLIGVRRVGKTTLSHSIPGVSYFDCELPRVRRIIEEDPEGFLRQDLKLLT